MRFAPGLFVIAATSFAAGVTCCATGLWLLSQYLADVSPDVDVSGVLKFQGEPADPSASGNPPNGYFIESTATERVYLEAESINLTRYVGQQITGSGKLSSVCGNDGIPCYPEIAVERVR